MDERVRKNLGQSMDERGVGERVGEVWMRR